MPILKPAKFNLFAISFWCLLALTAWCAWKAAANFYAGSVQRALTVKVTGSQLTFRWSSDSEPYYEMALDMRAEDGSERTFSWIVDAGLAIYPEEAFDVFEAWKPGSVHQINTLRGQSRQLRFNELEDNPEYNAGLGWVIFGVMVGIVTATVRFMGGGEESPWVVMLLLGMLATLGGVALSIHGARQVLTWEPVLVKPLQVNVEYDFTAPREGVKYDPQAVENMQGRRYNLYEYEWRGQKYRLGRGPWPSILSRANAEEMDPDHPERYYVNPKNRWEFQRRLDWWWNVIIPAGIVAGFGVAFLLAAWAMKKFL
jgi:hypothetical protein